ncbi:MAG: sodium:proton antiporter [Deltaproteobacteria bacterium]|nr:sodium:proton antiporter [Deltaproteobacteria bacterium]
MHEHLLLQLSGIICVGVATAWLAWRTNLPSILLLILAGIIAGPITGWLDVDGIFGELLSPLVSMSVAIILFEGGLTLNISDLKKIGTVVRNMLTLGVLVTWVLTTLASHYFLEIGWSLSTLIGAILVVTGPTVIGPLLKQIRPVGSVATVLRWEGIVIDPIGVMLAVLVFEVILIRNPLEVPFLTALTVLKTAFFGGGIGFLMGWLLIKTYKRNLVPHYLQNAFTLMAVIGSFLAADLFQQEAGLLTVTVMGVMMASQKEVSIEHIVEFKENLQLLLIPSLFIILASRLELSDINNFHMNSLKFIGALILVIRPASVILSSFGSGLNWKERLFLCWMAPRGIVAAAMASVITIELTQFGFAGAELLVPTVFWAILGTVAVYGLTAGPLAYLLKLADPNPQGMLIVGGHDWAQAIAKFLKDQGIKSFIVDTNMENIHRAHANGLSAIKLNILAEASAEELDLNGIGRLIAITPNEQVNAMAAMRFAPFFGKNKVFQLSTEHRKSTFQKEISEKLRGRILFSSGMTFQFISEKLENKGQFDIIEITEDDQNVLATPQSGKVVIPLIAITPSKGVKVFAADNAPNLKKGDRLLVLESKQEEI